MPSWLLGIHDPVAEYHVHEDLDGTPSAYKVQARLAKNKQKIGQHLSRDY